jgi:hypothetical protein
VAEIAIPKVWRSEVRLVLLYLITSGMSVYLSYLLPWTIIVGDLFTIGETRVMLHIPLLWFIPFGLLGTAVFRLYDVRYLIDTDGIEAKIGLLNFRKRTVRVRFEDIRSVKTHQDLIGRLFDIGRIEIRTAATSDLEILIDGVSAPLEIHSMIESEKAQRQHLTGRTTKDASSRFSKKGKVAFIFLLTNIFGSPWHLAYATPDKDSPASKDQIKSIRDVQQNDQLGRSLRESLSKSSLQGDADIKDKQNKLQNEEHRLRTAEEELLKSETKETKKIKPASLIEKTPKPALTAPSPAPEPIPSPQPTVIKFSFSTPTVRPKKEKPKNLETVNRIEEVTPIPPATVAAPPPLNTKKKPTTVKPAGPAGDISRLNAENARLRDEVAALKLKAKTELTEVDDLRVKLMVAETQVERLNKIIEQCSQRGDINSSYRSGAQETTSQDGTSRSMYATVIGNSIAPRTGPGNSFAPISSLRRGQRVPVEDRQGEWYKVRLPNGAFAWVHFALIKIGDSDDTFNLPGAVPTSRYENGSPSKEIKKPLRDPIPAAHEDRLNDVDKEAFRLLQQLKQERDSEAGS